MSREPFIFGTGLAYELTTRKTGDIAYRAGIGVALKIVQEILATAREGQCDLIVMASEGGRLRQLFGGTISERIVKYAPCPVLTMQPSAQIRIEEDRRFEVKRIEQWAA